MKKFVAFISFVIILFLCYLYFVNKPKNYEVEYSVKDYKVVEKFDKEKEYYRYTLSKDDYKFEFISKISYLSKRKLIKDIIEERSDNEGVCIKPVSDTDSFEFICLKDGEYVDRYMAGIEESLQSKKMNRVSNVDIYDDEHSFLIWNNKGFTSLLDNKKHSFLNKESYDNLLTYQMEKYLIVADYDQSRTFNKLYIYNNKDKSVDAWELDIDISFESYFMGDLDNKVYLFDQKNKVQYSLDIDRKKIEVTSDKDGGIYYDKGLTHKSLDSLAYNQEIFVKENKYNFILKDNKLYLRYFNSEQMIRISDRDIDHIVYATDNEVFYLVDEELYSYHIEKGEKLLLINFEWNFTYLNKVFIFD